MSPSVARHPHALYFDIPNAEKLSIPQQHFFIIDGHLRQLIEMINDLPAHFPGQVAVFGLAYIQRCLLEQPGAVRFHRTHMVGILVGDEDVSDTLGGSPQPTHLFSSLYPASIIMVVSPLR